MIGAGEALRWAIADAPEPARLFSGDELRQHDRRAADASTRSAHGCPRRDGFSYFVDSCAALERVLVVLDPLTVAVELSLAASHDADDEP